MFPVKVPFFIKLFYSSLIWDKKEGKKIIYLTFDDGPTPGVTNIILDELKKYNAKATFFCIGDNIEKTEDLFNRIKEEGHAVGNHSFDHLNGWKTNNKEYLQNIEKCQSLTQTRLFRPPFGKIKLSQINKLLPNYKIIMWSILSADFHLKISPEKCLKRVLKHTKGGDIVVFHDSDRAKENVLYSLPIVLEHFTNSGYKFEALS